MDGIKEAPLLPSLPPCSLVPLSPSHARAWAPHTHYRSLSLYVFHITLVPRGLAGAQQGWTMPLWYLIRTVVVYGPRPSASPTALAPHLDPHHPR